MTEEDRSCRDFLRHTLATLAYRAGKAIRDAPPAFPDFRIAHGTRTPLEILSHVGDLLDWSLHLAEGRHVWAEAAHGGWSQEADRFWDRLARLDEVLAGGKPLGFSEERLFQGPVADALTHVGQLAMLRRLCGKPVRGENYFKAEVEVGRVGKNQADPAFEFE